MRFEGAAAELDRLRRYHQQTLRDLPLGVCALGPDRRVLTWNLAMEVISGVNRNQSRGLTVDQLPAPWADLMSSCVESDEQHLHKIETSVGGRRRWFNLHKAAIEDPGAPGESGGVVILVEDLTDLHDLESELTHSDPSGASVAILNTTALAGAAAANSRIRPMVAAKGRLKIVIGRFQ